MDRQQIEAAGWANVQEAGDGAITGEQTVSDWAISLLDTGNFYSVVLIDEDIETHIDYDEVVGVLTPGRAFLELALECAYRDGHLQRETA